MILATLIIFGFGANLDAVVDRDSGCGVNVKFDDGVKALSDLRIYLEWKVGEWSGDAPYFTRDNDQFPLEDYTNAELTVTLARTQTATGVILMPTITFPTGATNYRFRYFFQKDGALPIPDDGGVWMVDPQGARSFRMEFSGEAERDMGMVGWEGNIMEAPMIMPTLTFDVPSTNPPSIPIIDKVIAHVDERRGYWTADALMGGVEYEVTNTLHTWWGSGAELSLYAESDSIPALFDGLEVNVTIGNVSGGVELRYNIHNSGTADKAGTMIGRANVGFLSDRAPTQVAADIADACLSSDWAHCVRFDFTGSSARGPVTDWSFTFPFTGPVAAPIGDDTAIVWAWDVTIPVNGNEQRSFKVFPKPAEVPGGGGAGDGSSSPGGDGSSSGGSSSGGDGSSNGGDGSSSNDADKESDSKGLSGGAIGGIAAACAVVVVAAIAGGVYFACRAKKEGANDGVGPAGGEVVQE